MRSSVAEGTGSRVLGYLLPGYGFRFYGFPQLSSIALAVYMAAVVVLLAELGFETAKYAFAAMIVIHCVSALLTLRHFYPVEECKERAHAAIFVLVLTCLGYAALQMAVSEFITPIQYHGKSYVVNGFCFAKQVDRGQRVVYRFRGNIRSFQNETAHGVVQLHAGLGLGEVLAIGGDNIEFTSDAVVVNGKRSARQQGMPVEGKLSVPENHWFIWPDLAITTNGAAAETEIQQMLVDMSIVNQKDFVGEIFRHWFWRKQL